MLHFLYIDILRIYAVLIVVIDHFFGGGTGGYLGVDVFFVISGFVFYHTFFSSEISSGHIITYYMKRVYRLVPAMMFVSILALIFAYLLLPAHDIRNVLESVVASLLLNANNYFYLTQDYFATDANYIPLLHFWSLGVEEQFYLMVPLLCLFATVRNIQISWLFYSIGLASLLFFIYVPYPESFYLLPARMFQFILGITAYKLAKSQNNSNFSVFALFVILLLISPFIPYNSEKVGVVVCTILTSVVLFLMPNTLYASKSTKLNLRKLGLLTYPIYLVHQPILVYSKVYFDFSVNFLNFILYVFACLALAYFVEKVAIKFRVKSSEAPIKFGIKSIGFASSWGAVSIFCLALYGFKLNQNLLIDKDKQTQIDELFSANYGLSKDCSSLSPDQLNCFSDKNKVLYWGDSYAMHVASSASLSELSAGQATMSSCAPIFDLSKINKSNSKERARSCMQFNDNVKELIESSQNLERVVLSSIFDFNVDTKFLIDKESVVEYDFKKLTNAFDETLRFLLLKGLKVVVVLPTPTNSTNLGMCLKRAIMHENSLDECQFVDDKSTEFEVYLKEVWGSNILDPAEVICNGNKCAASLNGIPLYIDDGHITKSGSELVFKGLY